MFRRKKTLDKSSSKLTKNKHLQESPVDSDLPSNLAHLRHFSESLTSLTSLNNYLLESTRTTDCASPAMRPEVAEIKQLAVELNIAVDVLRAVVSDSTTTDTLEALRILKGASVSNLEATRELCSKLDEISCRLLCNIAIETIDPNENRSQIVFAWLRLLKNMPNDIEGILKEKGLMPKINEYETTMKLHSDIFKMYEIGRGAESSSPSPASTTSVFSDYGPEGGASLASPVKPVGENQAELN